MAQIKFTDCVLKTIGRATGKNGTAQFQANYTNSVAKAMKWTDEEGEVVQPASFTHGQDLDGELAASTMEIKCSKLVDFSCEIKASAVTGFKAIRREEKGKRGKGHRWELEFTVKFPDTRGLSHLEKYQMNVGDSTGTVTIVYEPAAEQDPLPGTDAKEGTGDAHKQQVDEIIERSKKKSAAN